MLLPAAGACGCNTQSTPRLCSARGAGAATGLGSPVPPLPKARGRARSHFGYLQGWRLLGLAGQPAPVVNAPAARKSFLTFKWDFSALLLPSVCLIQHRLLCSPIRYLHTWVGSPCAFPAVPAPSLSSPVRGSKPFIVLEAALGWAARTARAGGVCA